MARTSGVGGGVKLPALWFFERYLQKRAAAIVVRGTRHREYLISRGYRRVHLIRDGYAEQTEVTSEKVESLRRKLGLGGDFIVGVMGSLVPSPRLGICYGWDLVEALPMLKGHPIRAVIIGDGPGLEVLKGRAGALGVLDRVVFCGRIPYADVPTYLRLLDIAMSTQTNNLPGQVRTTGKLPEYMAAGRFILASRVGEAALLLPEPMLLDYEGEVDRSYPSRLAERILEVQSNPGLLALRTGLPSLAREHCDYSILSSQWAELVRSV